MATETGLSAEAVQRLVESHRKFLAFLEKRVESRATAEDILQSAFLRGLERGGELSEHESVVAWFYRILRNAVIDHYRHRTAEQRAIETFGKEFTSESVTPALRGEICRCLNDLIQALKPEYREALEVVDLGEKSLHELAALSGITSGNAAVRVHRAREALRRKLVAACGSCAEHGCLDCECRSGQHRC